MSYVVLDPPLFPERDLWTSGETGRAAQDALVRYAQGGRVCPYGTLRQEQADYVYPEEGARVEIRASIAGGYGGLRWSVSYGRMGEPEAHGLSSGYSCAEDACYGACTMIEQHEREQYETQLVAGLA